MGNPQAVLKPPPQGHVPQMLPDPVLILAPALEDQLLALRLESLFLQAVVIRLLRAVVIRRLRAVGAPIRNS